MKSMKTTTLLVALLISMNTLSSGGGGSVGGPGPKPTKDQLLLDIPVGESNIRQIGIELGELSEILLRDGTWVNREEIQTILREQDEISPKEIHFEDGEILDLED